MALSSRMVVRYYVREFVFFFGGGFGFSGGEMFLNFELFFLILFGVFPVPFSHRPNRSLG